MLNNQVLSNMSFSEYLANPSLSSSGIKDLLQSPMKFWHGQRNKRVITPSQRAGSLLHAIILNRMESEFIQIPEELEGLNKNTKAYQDWKKNQVLTPVSANEIAEARFNLDFIDEVSFLFTGGQSEVSVFWQDQGVNLKARFDYINHSSKIFIDLKTMSNVNGDFASACANYFWYYETYIQMCLYQRAAMAVFGEFYTPMIVFVDRDCPRAIVRTFTIDDCPDIYRYANGLIDKALRIYKDYDDKYIDEPWVDPVDMRAFTDFDFPKAAYLGQVD